MRLTTSRRAFPTRAPRRTHLHAIARLQGRLYGAALCEVLPQLTGALVLPPSCAIHPANPTTSGLEIPTFRYNHIPHTRRVLSLSGAHTAARLHSTHHVFVVSGLTESWIASFCGLLGHEYFAEVSEDFIEDDFNLTGLQSQVPMYKEALEMILDVEPEDDEDEEEEEEEDEEDDEILGDDRTPGYRRASDRRHLRIASDLSVIESSAELLYGLIHQRYITSRPGIQQMAEKYELQHFGTCPRVNCNSCKVLPVGLNDSPGHETVKLFCPSCLDVYTPPNSRFQTVDGAFFGTTFPSLFFMTFTDLDIGGGLRASAQATMDALAQLQAQSGDGKTQKHDARKRHIDKRRSTTQPRTRSWLRQHLRAAHLRLPSQ